MLNYNDIYTQILWRYINSTNPYDKFSIMAFLFLILTYLGDGAPVIWDDTVSVFPFDLDFLYWTKSAPVFCLIFVKASTVMHTLPALWIHTQLNLNNQFCGTWSQRHICAVYIYVSCEVEGQSLASFHFHQRSFDLNCLKSTSYI